MKENKKYPCYECKERTIDCHDYCEAYKKTLEEHQKQHKIEVEKRRLENALEAHRYSTMMRMGKRK